MKTSGNTFRIGIAAAIIVGTICWLAFTGYGANKSYYVTIAELGGLGDKAYASQLRVEGFVQPGSIEQNGTHVSFVLNEFESHSPKAASGRLLGPGYPEQAEGQHAGQVGRGVDRHHHGGTVVAAVSAGITAAGTEACAAAVWAFWTSCRR